MKNLYRISSNSEKSISICEITKEEYKTLYPNLQGCRMVFLFNKDQAQILDIDAALFLSRKYNHLHVIDGYGNPIDKSDDLDLINGTATEILAKLYTIAVELNLDVVNKEIQEIKWAIRDARNEQKLLAELNMPIEKKIASKAKLRA